MLSQGATQRRHGSLANDTKALGKGETHQAAGITQTGHHPLDAFTVGSRHLAIAQLLLQFFRQFTGFVFVQLLALPVNGQRRKVTHDRCAPEAMNYRTSSSRSRVFVTELEP